MRTKNSIINIIVGILLQVIVILSGFFVKNIFISVYGSSINGLVSAVDQIVSSLAIVEGGIGAATIAMLYKPIQESDKNRIEEILVSSKSFFIKSGYIYVLLVAAITIFYPYLIDGQVNMNEARILIVILSLGGIIEFFFFSKYKALLIADQKLYILNSLQSFATILNALVVVYLMQNGYHYLVVRFVGALVVMIRVLLVYIFFKKKYPHIEIKGNNVTVKLTQRWGVMLHQISSLVLYNTDLLLITIFMGDSSLVEVSIYGVYSLISVSIINIVSSITSGVQSSFGDLLVSGNKEKVKEIYQSFEFMTLYIISIIYICFAVLLAPFIHIYSSDFTDANYNNLGLVVLFSIMVILQGIRIPSVTVVAAAGHYKETQYRALLEAAINIVMSIILVRFYGIYGILFGTILAYLYRNTDLIFYVNKYLIQGTLSNTVKRLVIYLLTIFGTSLMLGNIISKLSINSYFSWIYIAILVGIAALIIVSIVSFLFEKKEVMKMKKMIEGIVKKKK